MNRRASQKRFFIERALRKQSAKKAAETRKARRALLKAAGWEKKAEPLNLTADNELNDSIDDLFR